MAVAVAIYRFPELHRCTGLSRSTVWRMEAAGKFPARVRLSKNCVGWKSNLVAAWQRPRDTIEEEAAPVKMPESARAELAKKRAKKRAAPAKKKTKRPEVTASTG